MTADRASPSPLPGEGDYGFKLTVPPCESGDVTRVELRFSRDSRRPTWLPAGARNVLIVPSADEVEVTYDMEPAK